MDFHLLCIVINGVLMVGSHLMELNHHFVLTKDVYVPLYEGGMVLAKGVEPLLTGSKPVVLSVRRYEEEAL